MTLDATQVTWPLFSGINPESQAAEVLLETEWLGDEFALARKHTGALCHRMLAICIHEGYSLQPNTMGKFFKKNADGLVRYECAFFDRKYLPQSPELEGCESSEIHTFQSSFAGDMFAKVGFVWSDGLTETPILETEFDARAIPESAWDFIRQMLQPFPIDHELNTLFDKIS